MACFGPSDDVFIGEVSFLAGPSNVGAARESKVYVVVFLGQLVRRL